MCPIEPRLAAAASGEDAAAVEHARECFACSSAIAAQREVMMALGRLAPPPLRAERRAALAAEVMAQSDIETTPAWRGGRVMVVSTLLVAAAALALILFAAAPRPGKVPDAPSIAVAEELAIETSQRAQLAGVPEPRRADVVARGADFARVQRGDADVVTLRDGEVSVDNVDREPITIVAGDTRVTITSSRVKVVARRGVIVTTHVFAGTAHVATKGKLHVIDAGDVWMRPAASQPEATKQVKTEPATKAADSLDAFRIGWEALRDRRHAAAIEAFDRAIDPVVAEDAAFWAAIAAERHGDLGAAATRLRTFLAKYPGSPRSEAAKAALERVLK